MHVSQAQCLSSPPESFVDLPAAEKEPRRDVSDEVLAGLRVLAYVAKADGYVLDSERLVIDDAIKDLLLAPHITADSLLASSIDLDSELLAIQSHDVKLQTFESACALVYVEGQASPVKRAMLEKIRVAFCLGERFDTSDRFQKALEHAFAIYSSGEYEVHRRDCAIDDEIARSAARSAALASASLPDFCEGADLLNHVRLARKIGSFYGYRVDAQYWKTFVTNVVGPPTFWSAVSLLGRRLLRSRSASSYASVYALGKVTAAYFANGEAMSTDELRSAFKQAKKDGLAIAKQAREQIDDNRTVVAKVKPKLDAELARGGISEEAYMRELACLGERPLAADGEIVREVHDARSPVNSTQDFAHIRGVVVCSP